VLATANFDAYASVLSWRGLHNHAPPSVGHKGLFFERLDAGIARWRGSPGPNGELTESTPQLEPHARGLYYVRNRWLDPHRGRWLTSDPNATGQPLVGLNWGGGASATQIDTPDLRLWLGNGSNLYGYVESDPINQDDPAGLFALGLSLMQAGMDAYASAEGVLDSARMMRNEAFGLRGMIDTYAAMQLMDAEIAMDWSMPDDWFHSTGWYGFANQSVGGGDAMPGGRAIASQWQPLDDRYHNRGADARPTRHGLVVRSVAVVMSHRYGPQNVRMNQALSDMSGKALSNMRPDIQVWDEKRQKWVVVEIEDGNTYSATR
jgi:RHS repeat-associated protein